MVVGGPAERSFTEPVGEVELLGRITAASNATFFARVGDIEVVYKPIDGERPLWDFPSGTLAHREIAAFAVSEATGWNIVPPTWLADGPFGVGMLQLWQDVDEHTAAVDVVPAGGQPPGWLTVFDGLDSDDRPVCLVHEDTVELRRMAVFDVIINNADRKGGHVLPVASGHRYGVDHGVTFHEEHKLRTVLWGWIGEELAADDRAGIERVIDALDGPLGRELTPLLSGEEILALHRRCERLLAHGRFPAPRGDMPAVPWPLF